MNFRAQVRGDLAYTLNATLQGEKLPDTVGRGEDGFQEACINCKHFDETTELCSKFQSRPPARVIAMSCGTHYEDKNDVPY